MITLRSRTTAALAVVTAGALTAAACGTRALPDTVNGSATTGAPVSVACEPSQRAIVRPVTVNGAVMSQVECTSIGVTAGYQSAPAMQPGAMPVSYTQPAFVTYPAADNARVVPASYTPARSVAPRHYASSPAQVRSERTTRSVKKSALIIGGSAGAGAGIGAAIGGKKGALIGALLGGGGATVWDQLTRHGG